VGKWYRSTTLLAILLLAAVTVFGCERQTDGANGSDGNVNPEAVDVFVNQPPPGASYRNPRLRNIADPSVLRASDGKYYAYPTGGNKFKVYSSSDLVTWKDEGVALQGSEVPWADNKFWAPDVKLYKGKYYMFFSAANANDYPRLGVAVSDKPTGPFHTPMKQPMFDFGSGTIDTFALLDDNGKNYLYFSQNLTPVDGHKESSIHVVELSDDLMSVKGDPVKLTHPDQSWEMSGNMRWNEGAWVIKHDGTYYLMYSSNCYCGKKYAVGYATSKSPTGPFVKYKGNPVLSAEYAQVSGTGHHAVVASPDGKELYIVYHSHIDVKKGGGARELNIDRMGFRPDGTIYIDGPTTTDQPKPSGTSGVISVASEASVTASPAQSGEIGALTDGEIGIYKRTAVREYTFADKVGTAEATTPWVKLEWAEPRELNSVWIYDSGDPAHALTTGKLEFDDGTTANGLQFPATPGAAAVVNMNGKKVKWIKFIPTEASSGGGQAALSEIVVLGK
jgi:GH43 family beta-xylosidase